MNEWRPLEQPPAVGDTDLETMEGSPVRIYATDGAGGYPVHGAVENPVGGAVSRSWTRTGDYPVPYYRLRRRRERFAVPEAWGTILRNAAGELIRGAPRPSCYQARRVAGVIAVYRLPPIEGCVGDGMGDEREGGR